MASPLMFPFRCPVAGVSYRQGDVRQVTEGDPVVLKRSPGDGGDPNAVRVLTVAGAHLGFVPAALAGRLVLSGDGPWDATVDDVLRGETWGLRIVVQENGTRDVPEAAPVPTLVFAASTPEPEPVGSAGHAYSRSGRDLGVVDPDASDSNTVVVEAADGTRVRYPAAVVKVVGE